MWDELWRFFQADSKTFQLLDYNIEVSDCGALVKALNS